MMPGLSLPDHVVTLATHLSYFFSNKTYMQTDFLVIGSGIAGLTYALKTAQACPDKTITILTKAVSDETNTKYAQGGVAGVMDFDNDSFEKHIEDTLIAGDGLCNPAVVEIVVKEGVDRINEIIEWGAHFDKDQVGEYALGQLMYSVFEILDLVACSIPNATEFKIERLGAMFLLPK